MKAHHNSIRRVAELDLVGIIILVFMVVIVATIIMVWVQPPRDS